MVYLQLFQRFWQLTIYGSNCIPKSFADIDKSIHKNKYRTKYRKRQDAKFSDDSTKTCDGIWKPLTLIISSNSWEAARLRKICNPFFFYFLFFNLFFIFFYIVNFSSSIFCLLIHFSSIFWPFLLVFSDFQSSLLLFSVFQFVFLFFLCIFWTFVLLFFVF